MQHRDAPEPGRAAPAFGMSKSNVSARGKEGLTRRRRLQVGAARRLDYRAAWATTRSECCYSVWAGTGASWQVFLTPCLCHPGMGSLVLVQCCGL